MKAKLLWVAAFFAALLLLLALWLWRSAPVPDPAETRAAEIVALNEIESLVRAGENEAAQERIAALAGTIEAQEPATGERQPLWPMAALCLVFLALVTAYLQLRVVNPFERLEQFAGRVAAGDLELPLQAERSDYFGRFTWAFDSMRSEIVKARHGEKEAIENNKTVIATLSHDIKTPIASIRAYAEGLQANLDTTAEKRERYAAVIMKKCDEVTMLTNDLFLHALSDLDRLKVRREELALCALVRELVDDLAGERDDLQFAPPDFEAVISADPKRVTQILENLVNNARKYAKTRVDLSLTREGGFVSVHVRDYGGGIPDEDFPFIFDKFYRGKNCGAEQGSGLGLFIVKTLAEQMDGTVTLTNREHGLEAVLAFPIKNTGS